MGGGKVLGAVVAGASTSLFTDSVYQLNEW